MAIKTLFLAIFDPRSSIVKSAFDSHLSSVLMVALYIFFFVVCVCVRVCVCVGGGLDYVRRLT